MALPPFVIAETEPASSDFISAFPTNEQNNRDVIESWLLAISTNQGVLRADAMPSTFENSLVLSALDTDDDVEIVFKDEAGVVQSRFIWDESADTVSIIMYQDDGTTARSTLTLAGDTAASLQFNGSEVIRANSALATAIVGTGALDAGSITSGFGSIDIGTDSLTAGAGSFTTGTFSSTLGVTGVLSALASLELGHASDTTLSRGAAGFLAVEGKAVPSPASQAEGDILYRGASQWSRLAKGTASQVLYGGDAPSWGGAPALTKSYQSSQQAISDGGTFTLAHGMGVVPKLITAHYVCTVANNGWSVGDLMDNTAVAYAPSSGGGSWGPIFAKDATNIVVRMGSAGFLVGNKTTGAIGAGNNSQWEIVITAFA